MEKVLVAIALVLVGVVLWRLRSQASSERKAVLARLAAEREEHGDHSPLADLFREVGVPQHEMFGLAPEAGDKPSADPSAAMFSETEIPEPPHASALRADPHAPDPHAPDLHAADPLAADQRVSEQIPLEPIPGDATDVRPRVAAAAPLAEDEPTGADLRKLLAGIKMPCDLQPLGPLKPSSASFSSPALGSVIQAGLASEFERLGCTVTWSELTVAHVERNGLRGLTTIYPDATQATHLDGRPLFSSVPSGHCVVRMIGL